MIIAIIGFIFAMVGIYGYYNDLYLLLYVGGLVTIIEYGIGLYTKELKGLTSPIIFAIIGIICVKKIILGFFLGICFENIITGILSVILILVTGKKGLVK